ncbi:sugar ABC transporter substrate-binding protein [Pullulanibacillus camelliae]|uniref:Sugar ABC transporter substrate-binding protein n=1 Tax=Pullulanibacillus camelliae TaxID=1707096 RepID=A0A8J2VIX5_9BACL|nr:extracellular solute-binding protein [Pullulanibacillus camelliae]GGE25827.1 sugar ABC transporter substrate-binding protein [Pullulanibacillus camelliae]
MKKYRILLVLFSIVLIFMTGCAGSGSGASSSDGKVTITFMNWAGGGEKASLERAVEAFNKTHSDIYVKQEFVTGDYDTKINSLLAAGDPPDVAYVYEYNTMAWGEKGILEDLQPYFEKSKDVSMDDFIPGVLFNNKGKTWGAGIGPETMVLFYNKELFKDAGMAPPSADPHHPWTWDQFVNAAKKLTVDVNGKHPSDAAFNADRIKTYGAMIPIGFNTLDPLLRSNDGGYVSSDGKTIELNSPDSLEVLQKVADLSFKDHVAPIPKKASTLPDAPIMVQNKQLGMYISGNYDNATFGENGYQPGYAAIPMFKKPSNIAWAAGFSMFQGSKHKKAAWEFMEYMLNPKNIKSMYSDSVWIPTKKSWYTDKEKLKLWTGNSRHSGNYNKVVLPTMLDNIAQLPDTVTIKNFNDMQKYFDDATGKLFDGNGKTSAEKAIKTLDTDKIKQLLDGAYK